MSNTTISGRGSQQLTVSSASVVMTVPTGARRANIYVDVADVYMETDGTAATSSDRLVPAGSVIDLTDALYQLSQFAFIRRNADATLHISYTN